MLEIKICGINHLSDLAKIDELNPDYTGHIFYSQSPRNVSQPLHLKKDLLIKRIGVFVNEEIQVIDQLNEIYGFHFIQLHGNENPEYCKHLKDKGYRLIKAFSISSSFNFKLLHSYELCTDLFLFDTKGVYAGGNGKLFDWRILKRNESEKKYLLSGGISPDIFYEIIDFANADNRLNGIDLNSKFEIIKGQKDVGLLKEFINKIRNYELY